MAPLERTPFLFGVLYLVAFSFAARLSVPRLLLPYRQEIATNYTLELLDVQEGGCYQWHSSDPDLVLVQPLDGQLCSLRALVSAASQLSARHTAVITANNTATGELLRCDVTLDRIDSFDLVTTTRELFLEDSHDRIEVSARNDQGNTFSCIGGVSFDWTISSEPSAHRQGPVARFLPWAASAYDAPAGVQYWEQRGKQGWAVLLEGVGTGSATVRVQLTHPDYENIPSKEVTLLVVANLVLQPSRVYLLEGAKLDFEVQLLRQGRLKELVKPGQQYSLRVEDPHVAELDGTTWSVTALTLGSTQMQLRDSHLDLQEYSRQPKAEIHVVKPSYLSFFVSPGTTWALQEETEYCIRVELFDERHHKVHLSNNLVMEVKFPSKHLEVLWSSDNGTYHLVRTKGPGSTTIEGRFQGFRTPLGSVKRASYEIHGSQEIAIHERIVVRPGVMLLPWDPVVKPSYTLHPKATGGTNMYRWQLEDPSLAQVSYNPEEQSAQATVVTNGMGNTHLLATDAFNSFAVGKSLVSVQPVADLEIVPSLLETNLLNDLLVSVALYGYEDLPNKAGRRVFDDCSQIPLKVEVVDKARFIYVEGSRHPPMGKSCMSLQFSCRSPGHTRIYVSYQDGDVTLKSTTVLGCHKTLRPIHPAKTVVVAYGAFKDVAFEGGPRAWPMHKEGHYIKLTAQNAPLVSIMQIIDPFRSNRDMHVFRLLCKDLGETTLDLRVGNKASPSIPNPAKNEVSIKFVCGVPSSLELDVKSQGAKGGRAASCPAEGDRVPVPNSQELEVEVVVKDSQGRKFANISSLDLHWELSDYTMAAPESHRDVLSHVDGSAGYRRVSRNFQVVRPKGKSGPLRITARIVGYNHQVLRHSSLPNVHTVAPPVSSSLTVDLVQAVRVSQSKVSAFNHPSHTVSVTLLDGSGFFRLESSDPGKADIKYDESTREVKIIPKEEGSLVLQVHDLCLEGPSPTVQVHLVGLARIRLRMRPMVELGQEVEAHVELEDSRQELLPASALDLVQLRPLLASPILDLREAEGSNGKARFLVRGVALGTTNLQFVAGGPDHTQVVSDLLSVEVFAPLQLDPRNVTLVVGATFQLLWSGGPQVGEVEFFLESNTSVAGVTASGVVEARSLGSIRVTARAVGHHAGETVVYSQDTTMVHVVALHKIHIHTPINKLLEGSEVPAHAVGSNEFETPLSFCNAEPPLLFTWRVSDPRLVSLEVPLHASGLQPNKENACVVRLRVLSPGQVTLRLDVEASESRTPGLQQLLNNRALSAELLLEVLPQLELYPQPLMASCSPVLLTPHANVALTTSRDRDGAVEYVVQTKGAEIWVKDGVLSSGSHFGRATLDASFHEQSGLVQRTVTLVEVQSAAYAMAHLSPGVRSCCKGSPLVFPVGLESQLEVSLHNQAGRQFLATNSRLSFRSSRPDVVQVQAGSSTSNNSLELVSHGAGRAVVRVWDEARPQLEAFLSLVVGPTLGPSLSVLEQGDVLCLTTSLRGHDGSVGTWSKAGDAVRVDPSSGVAVAVLPGTALLVHDISSKLSSSLQVTVVPVSSIEVKAEGISQVTCLMETRISVLLGSRDSNIHGKSCVQGSELVVEPPFVCSLEFVNTSLDVSVEEVFSVAAGFSFADGGYYCALRPRVPGGVQWGTLEAGLELEASLGTLSSRVSFLFTGPFRLRARQLLLSGTQASASVVLTASPATKACLKVSVPTEDQLEVLPLREVPGQPHTWTLTLRARALFWKSFGDTLLVSVECPCTGQKDTLSVTFGGLSGPVPSLDQYEVEADMGWQSVFYFLWKRCQFWIATVVIAAATAALLFGYRPLFRQQMVPANTSNAFLNASGPNRSPSGTFPHWSWERSPDRSNQMQLWSVPDPHWSPQGSNPRERNSGPSWTQ